MAVRKLAFRSAAIALVLAGSVAAYNWYAFRNVELSQRPERSSNLPVFSPEVSSAQANLAIPYATLMAAADAAADRLAGERSGRQNVARPRVSIRIPGIRGRWPWGRKYIITEDRDVVLFDESVDFDYRVTYGRRGPITIGRSGDRIEVNLPLQFSGQGGLAGSFAQFLSANAKNFRGSGTLTARAYVRVDENFCPRLVDAQASFRWIEGANVDVIGRNCIPVGFGQNACIGPWALDVSKFLNASIQQSLDAQIRSINERLPCGKIREELARVWRTRSIPLPPVAGTQFYANVVPRGLSLPGAVAGDSALTLAGSVSADVTVSVDRIEESSAGALPVNHASVPAGGRIALSVPLIVSYGALNELAGRQLVGQVLRYDSPTGPIQVTIGAAEIYPAGDRLAVGLRFVADLPGRLFDATGWVWILAAPGVEGDGTVVLLRDIGFSRITDNEIWNLLSAAVLTQMPQLVGQQVQVDMAKDIAAATRQIRDRAPELVRGGGLTLALSEDRLHLGRIVVAAEGLVVEGRYDARLDLSLPAISR